MTAARSAQKVGRLAHRGSSRPRRPQTGRRLGFVRERTSCDPGPWRAGRASRCRVFRVFSARALAPILLTLFLLVPSAAHAGHGHPTTPISFQSASCFNVDLSQYPRITYSGPDQLDVDPFGPSTLHWFITVDLTATGLRFVRGAFVFQIQHTLLFGVYTGFSADVVTGDYVLDWRFLGGTRGLSRASGTGQTHGVVDLASFCAEYAFAGTLTGVSHH